MTNYGIKITRSGVNVSGNTDANDYIFHSSYPQLNVHSYGSFSHNFALDDLTIAHNLTYKPFVLVFMQNYDGLSDTTSSEYYQLGWSSFGASYSNYARAEIDSDKIVIKFHDIYEPKINQLDGFYYIFKNPSA